MLLLHFTTRDNKDYISAVCVRDRVLLASEIALNTGDGKISPPAEHYYIPIKQHPRT